MNFKEHFKQGKLGKNFGIPTGNYAIDKMLNGIQQKSIIGVAASPKCGKSKFTDEHFLIHPYLWSISDENVHNIEIEWIYYSYEMDRISKEFEVAAFIFAHKYNIWEYDYKGQTYEIDSAYLQSKKLGPDEKIIPVTERHEEVLMEIYDNYIVPLFGLYNEDGKQIKQGVIRFFEKRDNPTGLYKYCMSYASDNGKFIYEEYSVKDKNNKIIKHEKIVGWKPSNPNKRTIIITDHLRKLKDERGFIKKQTVDKWIEYQVDLRNWCKFIFVDIIHLNRGISDTKRLQFLGDRIYPTGDDIKDTGNLSEECNYLLTLFNPADDKYGLKGSHFGVDYIRDKNKVCYKAFRSVHLVESRDTPCPQHSQFEFLGGPGIFQDIRNRKKKK